MEKRKILAELVIPWSFWVQTRSSGVKKHAGDDCEVGFKPNMCFEGVLKHFDFSKNPDLFAYFFIPINIETSM